MKGNVHDVPCNATKYDVRPFDIPLDNFLELTYPGKETPSVGVSYC